ncbi:MAG: PSD1 and planctomycete cytochrome C domain-containing protein [Acidobacteria bacterium]|nr:PSD1 and planctomycete cytochrome C domain-containing protein [Acidobacteriota bacterium]
MWSWAFLFLAIVPDFERDVAPILTANCSACHAGLSKASGFSVEKLSFVLAGGKKHGKAVVGGHPEQSVLIQMVKGMLAPQMPMGKSLAAKDVETLEAWVKALPSDAPTAKTTWRWPYEKPVKPQGRSVDEFVLAKLREKGLGLAPEADRRTLARRAYFDLIGLPPTAEETAAFVAEGDFPKLVEKLLADPRYGERWGRHWLDLARYGETSGLEGDGAIGNAWRYRDWVVDAFNKDLPYDQFIVQQLGGADEHSKSRNNYAPNVQGHVALGFLRLAPWDRSNLVADEVRANYLAEVTAATSSVFLGLTVGCARCHDHKYDPIPQKDYYRWQAFFNTVQVENVTVPYADEEFAAKATAKIKEIEARLKDGPEKAALGAYEKAMLPQLVAKRRELAVGKTLTDLRLEMRRKDASQFSKAERRQYELVKEDADRTQDPEEQGALNRLEKELMGRLRLDPARFEVLEVEDLRKEMGNRQSKVFSEVERDKHGDLSEALDVWRRRLGRWQPVTLTVKNVPGPPNGPAIAPVRVLLRGDYRLPGEPVEAGFPTAFTGKAEPAVMEIDRYRQFPTRGHRLTLAKWIASKENPLTARVMANRIWQYHFGTGIVATPSDFGVNGERPTHPELLDWLAHEFVESGWSIKAMHRKMMLSATYRQSGENAGWEKDAENKLLSRFPRRRLEGEELRDSILYLSGRLNAERGGPSVFPALPADLADFARYGRGGAAMWEPNEKDEEGRRRSIYTFQRRSMPLPMMAAFDAPVFSESCERRSATTTPLQALAMMNGNLMHEEAGYLAKRVAAESGDRAVQVKRAFGIVLGRAPSEAELGRYLGFSGNLEAICRVLLNANEFLYVD